MAAAAEMRALAATLGELRLALLAGVRVQGGEARVKLARLKVARVKAKGAGSDGVAGWAGVTEVGWAAGKRVVNGWQLALLQGAGPPPCWRRQRALPGVLPPGRPCFPQPAAEPKQEREGNRSCSLGNQHPAENKAWQRGAA